MDKGLREIKDLLVATVNNRAISTPGGIVSVRGEADGYAFLHVQDDGTVRGAEYAPQATTLEELSMWELAYILECGRAWKDEESWVKEAFNVQA